LTPGVVLLLWVKVGRPLRRREQVGVDGLLALALASMWLQDPLSDAWATWWTADAHALNFGNWATVVPWWSNFHEPGRQVPKPLLITPGVFVLGMILATTVGCAALRRARAR
jgi:hypothetical protein